MLVEYLLNASGLVVFLYEVRDLLSLSPVAHILARFSMQKNY